MILTARKHLKTAAMVAMRSLDDAGWAIAVNFGMRLLRVAFLLSLWRMLLPETGRGFRLDARRGPHLHARCRGLLRPAGIAQRPGHGALARRHRQPLPAAGRHLWAVHRRDVRRQPERPAAVRAAAVLHRPTDGSRSPAGERRRRGAVRGQPDPGRLHRRRARLHLRRPDGPAGAERLRPDADQERRQRSDVRGRHSAGADAVGHRRRPLGYLPFASLASGPLRIYTGTGDPALLLGLQAFWLAVLWPLAHLVWTINRERLVSHGG